MTRPALTAAAALFGVPVYGDEVLRVGTAYQIPDGNGRTEIHVGIPGGTETRAVQIVRDGLADVLRWLGEPARPLWLDVAIVHYRGRS